MHRMQTCVLLAALLAVVPVAANADCPAPTPHLYIGLDDDGISLMGTCGLVLYGGPQNVFLVVQSVPSGKGKVRFKLANPPAGVLVLSEYWPPHTGDRVTGMEIDLGCSTASNITLGSLTLFPTGSVPCTPWQVTDVEFEDCDGNPILMRARPSSIGSGYCDGGCSFQDCMGLGPYNLSPPDGATGVPLNTAFTWYGPYGPGGIVSPYDHCYIRLGTTPDCSDALVYTVPCTSDHSFTLDSLQPATTYYWQASWWYESGGCSSGDSGSSIVQSFTTAGPVATEATTWGRVKSMYRE